MRITIVLLLASTVLLAVAACSASPRYLAPGVRAFGHYEDPDCPYEVAAKLELINVHTYQEPDRAAWQNRRELEQKQKIAELLEETQANAVLLRTGGGPLALQRDTLQFVRWTDADCTG